MAQANTKKMTAQQKSAAFKFWLRDDTRTLVENLYCRWLDEREYEDINDYLAVIQKHAKKHGLEVIKMTKRPFGFVAKAEGKTYKFFSNSFQFGYERTA